MLSTLRLAVLALALALVLSVGASPATAQGATTTDVAFSAADFTSNGDKTWTVSADDVITHTYAAFGTLRWYALDIVHSDIGPGTTGNILSIALPFTVRNRVAVPAVISNGSVWTSDARCLVSANTATLTCVLNSGAVFTSSSTHGLRLQFWAEVP